jgi:para-aminobenzoate synthetase/4-amino-4-deoxychorismate lyase
MKGTARRGVSAVEDAQLARELAASVKNRAENVMIVDMVRNDLGRIARIGSVHTTDLFRIEPYPTLFQMTSTVQARSDASLARLLTAIFPSASITGAPKVSATRIIRQLEAGPRGVYTGAIGFLAPDGRAQFNVAIRTAVIDRAAKSLRYDVGSGVVWDSEADSEFEECWLKAQVITRPAPPFQLLESMLWTPEAGIALLDRHLARLCASADTFHFPCPVEAIRSRLEDLTASLPPRAHKLRLLIDNRGEMQLEAAPIQPLPLPQRLALASFPVEPDNLFLRHKTTRREIYEIASRERPDADDVLLWNRRGELTESTRANLVLRIGGEMLTPAAASGLLPGTLRAELLARGQLREAILTKEDLQRAEAVYLINSVRGWMPAIVVE